MDREPKRRVAWRGRVVLNVSSCQARSLLAAELSNFAKHLEQLSILEGKSDELFQTSTEHHLDAILGTLTTAEEQFADLKGRGTELSEIFEEKLTASFEESSVNFREGLEQHMDRELRPKIEGEAAAAACTSTKQKKCC